ncbi:MAG: hypothetical protein OEZ68_01435 [Gammaproteobacteria bacterium]|nr:hypothetical protein [Gammaproteobacteria bacterium]MDH5799441.1 hypothetical protein [Gammaproteobacteria bacterium]
MRTWISILAVLVVLIIAACGGEDDRPPYNPTQFEIGQALYNDNCAQSGCHISEDDNSVTNGFSVLCTTADAIKFATEPGSGLSMPTFNFDADQEAAISNYLFNVRPQDC